MNALSINYRELSYETLARIIDLANRLACTPEEAAVRYLSDRAHQSKEDAA